MDHIRDILEFQLTVPEDPEAAEKIRVRNRRRAFAARCFYVLAAVLLGAILIRQIVSHRTYTAYETVSSRNVADNISSYQLCNGRLLRYSQDGLSLLDTDLSVVWNQAYDLTQPVVVTAGGIIAAYDRRGTQIVIFNERGERRGFGTESPIISARVSEAGNVVVALENGDYTKLVYYTADGEVIAELAEDAAREEQIGAFAISGDGKTLAVAYFKSDKNGISTQLVFYDFGKGGQDREDHIVDRKNFEEDHALIPMITWNRGSFLAVRDNGFCMYRGNGEEDAFANEKFSSDILSVVLGDDCIGFIFDNPNEQHRYRMVLYDMEGHLMTAFPVDLPYERVSISEGSIVFSNGSEMAVYTMDGFCQFSGELGEGTIFDLLKVGSNRYFIVTDMKAGLIRLK